ncbi:MAG: DEAD/DEAH box helicase family protein [Proteobacteria bacterium]|nr:DEAD/DEAH box helicase family protein [Pseudomonadota bacterium]
MAAKGRKKKGAAALFPPDKPLKFDDKLVLNQWILSLFGVSSFERLTENMKAPELEGFDEDNVSRYYRFLRAQLFDRAELPFDVLLGYDQNIVRHWLSITERRNRQGQALYPKYFQYFSLLFAEIYLDRYFRNPEGLLEALNRQVEAFNTGKAQRDQVQPYQRTDLNKLAFWSATGSGKTLVMHVNILQYRHYLELHGQGRHLNRIILLTPNEGLSHQHLEEFRFSGMEAELFSKDGRGLFTGQAVEIIAVHKLREESGDKTVAIDAFEGNNLVLVDEGHRGTSGAEVGLWMKMRNQLCERGFSFEYSATFGQAMKASSNKALEQEYARCILFDYSYKYFYHDGYGKDYRILNLEDDSDEAVRRRYLTACLLAFYQQLKLYAEQQKEFRPFLIERPLWIFVGGSVNAVRTQHGRKVSDVVDILLFLADFVSRRAESVDYLDRFLQGRSGLLDAQGNDLFARAFTYLFKQRLTGEQVYHDILRVLFNAASPAGLHIENLKGAEGEIALRLGDNEPFGLINVGDAANLCKLCEEQRELVVSDREFAGSLFRTLSATESSLNILIGSKKFTEGWSSWRVSTMGLMNVGRSEGPQIIQLFGRGVRLKGLDFCLKRSRKIAGVRAPADLELLETLNIFGIRANYMRQFKEYLEDEGLPANEDRIEFVLPVIKDLGQKRLKTIQLKEGVDYKRQGPRPTLKYLERLKVDLDWYPKIQALASAKGDRLEVAKKDEGSFTAKHLAFMNLDEICFEMQRFKNERSWHNLNLSRSHIAGLLSQPDWYRLYIPKEELEITNFSQVRRWQEIALTLLKKFCDRYYKVRKAEFENQHLEYRELTADDRNFFESYQFLVEQSRNEIITTLQKIKELIDRKELKNIQFHKLYSIMFNRHLYQPLIYVKSDFIEVKPVVLDNEGERDFVLDLQTFCEKNQAFFRDKELYLLRNLSRGRGIGFFEAGNFYPDFILWLFSGGQQYITFIDPKGLRNLDGPNDPKIRFYSTIKELEQRLADPQVTLNSFIISSTPLGEVSWWSNGMTKADFEKRHVLFQKEDRDTYIQKLLNKTLLT